MNIKIHLYIINYKLRQLGMFVNTSNKFKIQLKSMKTKNKLFRINPIKMTNAYIKKKHNMTYNKNNF